MRQGSPLDCRRSLRHRSHRKEQRISFCSFEFSPRSQSA
ncbi:hypothetical protein CSPAE12_07583 [Colletotrichum incanum]|nr:hypothetical protein CSPAE12_07583 [Colletotrichum incanum]